MNAKQRRQQKRKFKHIVELERVPWQQTETILHWLKENVQGEYKSEWKIYYFSNEADATFFTLKWR